MELSKKQIVYLILVIIWMIVVFLFSNESSEKSSKASGGITEKVVEVIIKDPEHLSQSKRDTIETIIRKLAHFTLYTIGGILIANFMNTTNIKPNSMLIVYSILFATMYAITDEIHQLFVPGRSGEIRDILIDTLGASFGTYVFTRIKNNKRRK